MPDTPGAEDLEVEDHGTMALGRLVTALQGLTTIELPETNAIEYDDVVIRIDLGPDQDFTVSGVYVEDRSAYSQDDIVVIEAGPHWTAPTDAEAV